MSSSILFQVGGSQKKGTKRRESIGDEDFMDDVRDERAEALENDPQKL